MKSLFFSAIHTDPTLGARWLTQMGQAAQQSGMTIEYCMALPRQGLMSLTIPAVTHARVSEDFANPQVFFG